MTHELEPPEARRTGGGNAARHDVRPRVAVVERADRHDIGLAVHELDAQTRELPEIRAIGIRAAALGHLTRRTRDRGRARLEQLGHVGGRFDSRARQLGDRPLDPVEQVGQRREVVDGGEPTQRLDRAQHVLERIVRERVRSQGLRGAVEGARDRRPLAGHERPRPGVEANRLCRADLGRRPTGKLLELLGQRFGLRGVGVGPTRRAAHEDLQIVHAPHGKLLGLGIPPAAALAHGPRQRLEPRGGTRDRRLIGHERTAAQRAREAHQLVGAGTVALGEQRVEALEILPRLEGEEVRHAERLGGFGHGA